MNLLQIPKTAPFAEEEIELLNRVVGMATPTQRVWLAGFLAGLGASSASQPSAAPVAAEPLTILYATESGNSEKLAADLGKAARKNGLKPTLVDMGDLELATLASARRLLVIAATWGEGEPTARAVRAYNELMSENAPRLDGVEFGVLALGDSAYGEFCATGGRIDQRLTALGGKRVIERVDCDLDFATPRPSGSSKR
jgi:sulfite reductase (NADPH) flavoprotein alpha-component